MKPLAPDERWLLDAAITGGTLAPDDANLGALQCAAVSLAERGCVTLAPVSNGIRVLTLTSLGYLARRVDDAYLASRT